jgi:hypothetical protein
MTDTDDTKPTAAHTPEPWHYDKSWLVDYIIAHDPTGQEPYGIYVAEIAHGDDVVGRFATREQHEANGRRIVAAVNACQGISTEALQQGVVREGVVALAS